MIVFLGKGHIIKLTVAENLSIVSLRVRGHWVRFLGLKVVSNINNPFRILWLVRWFFKKTLKWIGFMPVTLGYSPPPYFSYEGLL